MSSGSLPDGPRVLDRLRLAGEVTSLAAHVASERLFVRRVDDPRATPPTIDTVTPTWLTRVLAGTDQAVRVEDVRWSDRSAGTSVRGRLHVTYNAAGAALGLPDVMFVKSTPTLFTRVANGLSGVSTAEAGFYRDVRRDLDLEAPVAYHSSIDPRRHRALHLLEDLCTTKQATFCSAVDTVVTKSMAEEMVDTLAELHANPSNDRVLRNPPPWLGRYRDWWATGIVLGDLRRYHRRGLLEAEAHVAPALRGAVDQTWQAFRASVEVHDALRPTLIHNDVHLGNWYQTGDGRMGLCDWQCTTVGHWSRDLAYCLASACSVGDRRTWERELVARHAERLRQGGHEIADAEAFDHYRRQLPGALLMWTPTYSPPRFFPDMQPRPIAAEMVHRITTAMDDLDVV